MAARVGIILTCAISLFSLILPTLSATDGIATYYGSAPYTGNACYGSKNPYGVWIAAASDKLWDGGKICGKRFKVTCTGPTNAVPHPCTGKSVTITVINYCPGCTNTFDLSQEAFATIANPTAGVIKISYEP
ncbi:hypothetical protein MLD38_014056 [Melastoma candidum]|uniref:Uncharacterized protein n=1 Tax=Melastoma candidum TaxID=119954 RepID=A0ACB9RBN5_9MYRT|nr:hypothetical protein MLD38_014056 [Melastoma candidum]